MPDTYSDHPTDFGPHKRADADDGATAAVQSSPITGRRTHSLKEWILLPLVAVITLVVMGAGVRFIANREIGDRKPLLASACIQGQGVDIHGVPNSVCRINYSRGHTVEFKFNSCGDRTLLECGPKPEGVYRIVIIGASNPMGFGIPVQEALAAQLSIDLSRQTGRRVEVYNAALLGSGGAPETLAKRMPEFLALHPDLILWVVSAWDVNFRAGDDGEAPAALLGKPGPFGQFMHSRVAFFLRNILYRSQSLYMAGFLTRAEAIAQANATARNKGDERLRMFSMNLQRIVDQAKAAGVPVAAAFLPVRGESASLFMRPRPAGVDIDQMIQGLRGIMAEKGVIYLDVMPQLLSVPALDSLYDQIGDHLNGPGHAIFAQIVANTFTSSAVPALYRKEPSQPEKMQQTQPALSQQK